MIALDGITTTVRAGEVTCVLGDNGAGKSTLIKILAGVHRPTRGEVLLDGRPVGFGAPARGAGRRDRDGLPGPRDDPADGDLAELLPRRRAHPRLGPVPPVRRRGRPGRSTRRALADDGHRHPRPRPAGRHAVRRRAPVGGDRAGGPLRRAGADPRRADVGARASSRPASSSATSRRPATGGSASSSSPTTRTTPTRWATASWCSTAGRSLGSFAKADVTRDELTRLMAGGAELDQLAHELERPHA